MRNRIGAPLLIVLLPLALITFGGCTEKDSTLSDGDGDTDSPGDGEEDGDLNHDIDEASISEEEEEGREIDDPCTERLTDSDPNYTRQCIGSCPDCQTFSDDILLFFESGSNSQCACGNTRLEIRKDLSMSLYNCLHGYAYYQGNGISFQGDLSGMADQVEVEKLIADLLEDIGEYRVTQHLAANCCDGSIHELYIATDPPVRKLEAYFPDREFQFDTQLLGQFIWNQVLATLDEGTSFCSDYCYPNPQPVDTICLSNDALCDCGGACLSMSPILKSCRVTCGQSEKHSLGCQLVDGVADCVCGEEPESDGDGEIE